MCFSSESERRLIWACLKIQRTLLKFRNAHERNRFLLVLFIANVKISVQQNWFPALVSSWISFFSKRLNKSLFSVSSTHRLIIKIWTELFWIRWNDVQWSESSSQYIKSNSIVQREWINIFITSKIVDIYIYICMTLKTCTKFTTATYKIIERWEIQRSFCTNEYEKEDCVS